MKKIIIASYYFYPENTPRAFRTYELARELAQQGHAVLLLIPNKQAYHEHPVAIDNLEIKLLGKPRKVIVSGQKLAKKNNCLNLIKNVCDYWFPLHWCKHYLTGLYNYLCSLDRTFDILISISVPAASHIAVCKAVKRNINIKNIPTKIAEYSDPFSNNRATKVAFFYRWIDKWIGKTFDYFFIPVASAVNTYKSFIDEKKIKIVPQGFRLDEVVRLAYKKNKIPTFAYAGVFYKEVRDPSFFLEYLSSLDVDFKFVVYCPSENNIDTTTILNNYKEKLGKKMEIIFGTKRNVLITELSGYDFLINFENNVSEQVPSKLIDYALTGRPILSLNKNNFNQDIFTEFMTGKYDKAVKINIGDYDIQKIAKEFII